PVPTAAAIATLLALKADDGEIYRRLDWLGETIEDGFDAIRRRADLPLSLVRQGSAFCIYFMDHAPVDWHDIASHHDFAADVRMRRALIERGIFMFPVATKQCSLSAAHTDEMVEETLHALSPVSGQPVTRTAKS